MTVQWLVQSIMIKITPEIVGIKIGKTEFKMVQYADDATIIIDGSTDSLQATLNVFEIYDTLSRLKVNTKKEKKTKIDCIGKKNCSRYFRLHKWSKKYLLCG